MKVLCFSPYARWMLHTLYEITIAHALKLRGMEVNFILCDGVFSECDIHWAATEPRNEYSCFQCQAIVADLFYKMKMPYKWLGNFLMPQDFKIAQKWILSIDKEALENATFDGINLYNWVISSVHSHFRVNFIDLNNPVMEKALRNYLYSGALAYLALSRIIDFYKPNVLLLFNGRLYLTRIAFELAKKHKIHTFIHERGALIETLQFHKNEFCHSYKPILQSWEYWREISLKEEELKTIYCYLEDKAFGRRLNWKVFSDPPIFKKQEEIRNLLGIHNFKHIISLFTSSEDEVVATIEKFDKGFKNQQEWIEKTIEFFLNTPENMLLIRVHPNTGGRRATGNNVQQLNYFINLKNRLKNVENIKVILPEEEISSYSLIDLSHLGLVYLSTIGLEMACKGKKVIVCENAIYANEDFVVTVRNKNKFLQVLKNHITYLDNDSDITIAQRAYRFAYHYFVRHSIPFDLIHMPDIHTGIPRYHNISELLPGRNENLDKICDFILSRRETIIELPDKQRINRRRYNENIEKKFLKRILSLKNIYVIKEPPLISVVVPCYNYGQYLETAIISVINQTFSNWEVIIINDGSTDNTSEIAKRLIKKYSEFKIKLIEQDNSGQPAIPRNRGVKIAKGRYILCLDADDMIAPTMLEECLRIAEAGYPLVYTDVEVFEKGQMERKDIWVSGEYNFDILKFRNFIPTASLFLKSAWEKVGGYRTNVKGYEDWDFWIALGAKGYYGARVAKPLFKYFKDKDGLYTKATKDDARLKANIVLNNRDVYPSEVIEWASAILNGESWASPGERGIVPIPQAITQMKLKKTQRGQIKMIFYTAKQLYNNGQEEEAIKLFKKVLQLDSKFALAHNDLAFIYWQKKDVNKALYHLTKAMELAPNDRDIIRNCGRVMLELHKVKDT